MEGRRQKPRRERPPPAEDEDADQATSAAPPCAGDTLPWNLSKLQRVKRSKSGSGEVLDPAERAVIRIAGQFAARIGAGRRPPVVVVWWCVTHPDLISRGNHGNRGSKWAKESDCWHGLSSREILIRCGFCHQGAVSCKVLRGYWGNIRRMAERINQARILFVLSCGNWNG